MKKITLNTLLAITLMSLPLISGAQQIRLEGSATIKEKETRAVKVEAVREKIASSTKDRIEAIKDRISSSTNEKTAQRTENRRETLRKIAEIRINTMIRRFEATIQREESILSKIISRIEKVKSAGGKTADAEKHVLEARHHLTEAGAALASLKSATSSADVLVDASISNSLVIPNGLMKIK
ncbi:MAG TPA: hypothetical protein VGC58_00600, partial [Candidatus Paceibacterota bacterium]